MAGRIKTTAIVVVAMAMAMTAAVFAEDYDVGGDNKWIRPTNNPRLYSDWASGKTFRVGDVLEFEFQAGAHDVATVTKEAYDSCNKANLTNVIRTSPAKITLNTTGPHYFICAVGDHCSVGQKLSVNVTAASGPGGGATTPASGPTGSTTTPSGTPTAPPPNSASSLGGAATFLVAVMSSAVALLC